MKTILIAAVAAGYLTIPILAHAEDATERVRLGNEPAIGETLAPRPGATIRETAGAASPEAPILGRVVDDRLIVEERPATVSPPNCRADPTPAACAR